MTATGIAADATTGGPPEHERRPGRGGVLRAVATAEGGQSTDALSVTPSSCLQRCSAARVCHRAERVLEEDAAGALDGLLSDAAAPGSTWGPVALADAVESLLNGTTSKAADTTGAAR